LAFKDLQSPVELFYILMCGAGVGLSVEKQFIEQMPEVKRFTTSFIGTHVVADSREGWADSLKLGIETWFNGQDIDFDYSQVRPRGARLKTMGGRASGPDPLRRLHTFVREMILKAQGRKLTSIEWLDIGNMIGEVVVVGGVRRSSEISFSDLDDSAIRDAKIWPFPEWRYMSNNSAVYHGKPDLITFMREWTSLAASGSGERGVFNTKAATNTAPRRNGDANFRTNPCVPAQTQVLTKSGYVEIDSLVGQKVEVWNGFEWSEVTPAITGHNQELVTVNLSSGQSLTCTKAHRWVVLDGKTEV
jgi:ribonucleoside-diphosphate reductase alpha chain